MKRTVSTAVVRTLAIAGSVLLMAGFLSGLPVRAASPDVPGVTALERYSSPSAAGLTKGSTGTVTATRLNIRKGPGTGYGSAGYLNAGDRVTLEAVDGSWGQIDRGWISLNYLKADAAISAGDTVTVTAATLNVRKGAGTNFTRAGHLNEGAKAEILEVNGSWGRTKDGWICLNYVKLLSRGGLSQGDSAKVTAGTLNIRSGAGTDQDIVGSYRSGDMVKILEVNGNWVKTDKGWISASYLRPVASATAAPGSIVKVTAQMLNIRKGAGTGYPKAGTYKAGDRVVILEVSGNWGRTKDGWISLSYVTPDVDTRITAGSTVEVIARVLNVRKGAGTNYQSAGTMMSGETVKLLEVSGGWGRTEKGWICLNFVKLK